VLPACCALTRLQNWQKTAQTLEIFNKFGIEIGLVLRKILQKQKINQKANCSADSTEKLADSSASIGPGTHKLA
jgi:replicative superfamily II helicase